MSLFGSAVLVATEFVSYSFCCLFDIINSVYGQGIKCQPLQQLVGQLITEAKVAPGKSEKARKAALFQSKHLCSSKFCNYEQKTKAVDGKLLQTPFDWFTSCLALFRKTVAAVKNMVMGKKLFCQDGKPCAPESTSDIRTDPEGAAETQIAADAFLKVAHARYSDMSNIYSFSTLDSEFGAQMGAMSHFSNVCTIPKDVCVSVDATDGKRAARSLHRTKRTDPEGLSLNPLCEMIRPHPEGESEHLNPGDGNDARGTVAVLQPPGSAAKAKYLACAVEKELYSLLNMYANFGMDAERFDSPSSCTSIVSNTNHKDNVHDKKCNSALGATNHQYRDEQASCQAPSKKTNLPDSANEEESTNSRSNGQLKNNVWKEIHVNCDTILHSSDSVSGNKNVLHFSSAFDELNDAQIYYWAGGAYSSLIKSYIEDLDDVITDRPDVDRRCSQSSASLHQWPSAIQTGELPAAEEPKGVCGEQKVCAARETGRPDGQTYRAAENGGQPYLPSLAEDVEVFDCDTTKQTFERNGECQVSEATNIPPQMPESVIKEKELTHATEERNRVFLHAKRPECGTCCKRFISRTVLGQKEDSRANTLDNVETQSFNERAVPAEFVPKLGCGVDVLVISGKTEVQRLTASLRKDRLFTRRTADARMPAVPHSQENKCFILPLAQLGVLHPYLQVPLTIQAFPLFLQDMAHGPHAEVWRIASFAGIQIHGSVLHMARNGLYFVQDQNEIRCYSCKTHWTNWSISDLQDTSSFHRPNCPHTQGIDTRNIPIDGPPHTLLPPASQSHNAGQADIQRDCEEPQEDSVPSKATPAEQVEQALFVLPSGTATQSGNKISSYDSFGRPAQRTESTRNMSLPRSQTDFESAAIHAQLPAQNAGTAVSIQAVSTHLSNVVAGPVPNHSITFTDASAVALNTEQPFPAYVAKNNTVVYITNTTTQVSTVCTPGQSNEIRRFPVQATQLQELPSQDPSPFQIPNSLTQNGLSMLDLGEEGRLVDAVLQNMTIGQASSPGNATVRARLMSFVNWLPSSGQSPRSLAIAGFYYIGSGDSVQCWWCGVILRNWRHSDDPWVTHVFFRFSCDFVTSVKGQNFAIQALTGRWRDSITESQTEFPPGSGASIGASFLQATVPTTGSPQEQARTSASLGVPSSHSSTTEGQGRSGQLTVGRATDFTDNETGHRDGISSVSSNSSYTDSRSTADRSRIRHSDNNSSYNAARNSSWSSSADHSKNSSSNNNDTDKTNDGPAEMLYESSTVSGHSLTLSHHSERAAEDEQTGACGGVPIVHAAGNPVEKQKHTWETGAPPGENSCQGLESIDAQDGFSKRTLDSIYESSNGAVDREQAKGGFTSQLPTDSKELSPDSPNKANKGPNPASYSTSSYQSREKPEKKNKHGELQKNVQSNNGSQQDSAGNFVTVQTAVKDPGVGTLSIAKATNDTFSHAGQSAVDGKCPSPAGPSGDSRQDKSDDPAGSKSGGTRFSKWKKKVTKGFKKVKKLSNAQGANQQLTHSPQARQSNVGVTSQNAAETTQTLDVADTVAEPGTTIETVSSEHEKKHVRRGPEMNRPIHPGGLQKKTKDHVLLTNSTTQNFSSEVIAAGLWTGARTSQELQTDTDADNSVSEEAAVSQISDMSPKTGLVFTESPSITEPQSILRPLEPSSYKANSSPYTQQSLSEPSGLKTTPNTPKTTRKQNSSNLEHICVVQSGILPYAHNSHTQRPLQQQNLASAENSGLGATFTTPQSTQQQTATGSEYSSAINGAGRVTHAPRSDVQQPSQQQSGVPPEPSGGTAVPDTLHTTQLQNAPGSQLNTTGNDARSLSHAPNSHIQHHPHQQSSAASEPQGGRIAPDTPQTSQQQGSTVPDHTGCRPISNPVPRRTMEPADLTHYYHQLLEENQRLRARRTCRICRSQNVDTIFLPCGHICACDPCAATIRECCLCFQRIRGTAHVYFD